jgi:hypothetical protein
VKASELRIGNLVQPVDDNWPVKVIGVEYINLEEFEGNPYWTVNDFKLNELTPIELNPEWLEKFGFENNRIQWRWHTIRVEEFGTISQSVFPGEYCLTFLDSIPYMLPTRIRYVHELQNLYFAITGQELEIVKEPA